MFDDKNDARWPTLVAGLILLIVLAAVAAMSAGLGALPETDLARQASSTRTRAAASQRLVPSMPEQAIVRMMNSLGPIDEAMSACFGDKALVAYDLGIAPGAAFEVLEGFLESAVPDVHARFREALHEFGLATGLDPTADLLPYLGHGVAVGLLPPEGDLDGWPLPRKVVITRVLDDEAVARYLEAWIKWLAGAVAPMTHGLLGASFESVGVGGFDLVGLRLDGLLPARLPLPSPSYVVADDYLIVSPVRSAVVETLNRLGEGCSSPAGYSDEPVVEEVWLNFPEWSGAWLRAEPIVASVLARLDAESSATIRACRSLVEFLGVFEAAHGTTSLTQEGGFVFQIEVKPVRSLQSAP
jgi:hypothetical protein